LQEYLSQRFKELITRLIPKQAQNFLPVNQTSQFYYIYAFRDQTLYAYLVKSSKSLLDLLNHAVIPVPAMTIGVDNVIRPEKLSEQLSDIAELFAFEYDSNLDMSSIPAIFILESSQFMVSSFLINDSYLLLHNQRELSAVEVNMIHDASPFIAPDTITRVFTGSGFINKNDQNSPENISIIYARESYLESWVKAIKLSKLSLAYLGPSSPPLLNALYRLTRQDSVFVDVQRLSSRIYTFLNGESFNLVFFALQIRKTLKQMDLSERFQQAPIYLHGLPLVATKDDKIENVVVSTVDYLFRQSKIQIITSTLKEPLPDQISRELALSALFISENL